MTQLLIVGTAILAQGPLTQDDAHIFAPDITYPKDVIVGWQIVDVEAPSGFEPVNFTWDGAAVQPKPVVIAPLPVPQEVTAFQAKAALLNAGLLTQVQTFMASGSAPAFAQLAWAEAPTFGRQSPTMLAMAQAMGMSSDELDNLFRAAALIVA